MKKLIVILIVLFSFAASAKPLVYNSIDFSYTPFVYGVCEDLGIEKPVYIQRTNYKVQGFAVRADFGYIIFVSTYAENMYQTIAHELVHVKQDIDGRWDLNKPTTIVRSFGNRYVSKEAKKIEQEADLEGRRLTFKYK